METLTTMTYGREGRVARITLNRPQRGNGITLEMPRELADCVERANLDPEVHVIALAGNGKGFCGGYDLVASAEEGMSLSEGAAEGPQRSPLDPTIQATNHDPERTWDPVIDFQMMSRNVRGFMSLFHAEKPVLCKVQGFCVAGGTDMALCSDLLVIEDEAKLGYPPARVWGVPTTAMWAWRIGPARAKRLLLTGDSISGTEAFEWGLATEAAPADRLDARFEALLERVARVPVNQLVMHKLLVNQALYAQGLHATQVLGTFFDGIARHTPEGYAFQRRRGRGGMARGGTRAGRTVRRRGPLDLQGVASAWPPGRPPVRSCAVSDAGPEITSEALRERIAGSLPANLGVEPIEIGEMRTTGRIVVDERHLHPGGLVHGGAWVALADSVAAWQTFRHLTPGDGFTTVEMKLQRLRRRASRR